MSVVVSSLSGIMVSIRTLFIRNLFHLAKGEGDHISSHHVLKEFPIVTNSLIITITSSGRNISLHISSAVTHWVSHRWPTQIFLRNTCDWREHIFSKLKLLKKYETIREHKRKVGVASWWWVIINELVTMGNSLRTWWDERWSPSPFC